jgi:hypothetical protein
MWASSKKLVLQILSYFGDYYTRMMVNFTEVKNVFTFFDHIQACPPPIPKSYGSAATSCL